MTGPDNHAGKRGFAVVALDDSKNGQNVGGAVRAARCFGAAFVVSTGRAARIDHPAAVRGYRHMPVVRVDDVLDAVPYKCETVAVEYLSGVRPLESFAHPERAYYVFGGEDRTLTDTRLDACDHVVAVSTDYCLNLAACVNVVLYDRRAKELRDDEHP